MIAAKIISGIGHGCDEEALRVVKLLKFSIDKQHRNKVVFHKTIQIHFKLPIDKKQDIYPEYNYQITPTKKKNHAYYYTINITTKEVEVGY